MTEQEKIKSIKLERENKLLLSDNLSKAEELDKVIKELKKVTYELAWIKRQMFGTKSERYIPDVNQYELQLDLPTPTVITESETVTYERKKTTKIPGHSREVMPTHLPFKDTFIEPKEDVSKCVKIGEESTWEYEYKPGSLFIHRYIRPKYKLDSNDIVIGTLPQRPTEKGNFGPGIMAVISIDKYLYHLPLYRQIKKFKDEYNTMFSESTFCDIIDKTSFWLKPIYREMKKDILKSDYLQADETHIPVLIRNKKGKTHKGYYWVYYDPINKIVIFQYCHTRKKENPYEFLKSFKGVLQVDGYTGYNHVVDNRDLTRASCMDHVRRKFEKSLDYNRKKADYAMNVIKSWYNLESIAKKDNYTTEQKLEMRKSKIKDSMADFKSWMLKEVQNNIPSSLLRKACEYAFGQWDGFKPFLNDGRVNISNIAVENLIRPVTLGRKNYMFKGSESGARRGAVIYSICATAHLNGENPREYIKELLTKLPAMKHNEIKTLLPYKYNS